MYIHQHQSISTKMYKMYSSTKMYTTWWPAAREWCNTVQSFMKEPTQHAHSCAYATRLLT
jgi:hypothetical protein